MNRYLYGMVAILLWALFVFYGLGELVLPVQRDTMLLSFAIVMAGGMAGGK